VNATGWSWVWKSPVGGLQGLRPHPLLTVRDNTGGSAGLDAAPRLGREQHGRRIRAVHLASSQNLNVASIVSRRTVLARRVEDLFKSAIVAQFLRIGHIFRVNCAVMVFVCEKGGWCGGIGHRARKLGGAAWRVRCGWGVTPPGQPASAA
jgi:hypothetical protein